MNVMSLTLGTIISLSATPLRATRIITRTRTMGYFPACASVFKQDMEGIGYCLIQHGLKDTFLEEPFREMGEIQLAQLDALCK